MKKIIFFIIIVAILAWAAQKYTGFKAVDLAKNYYQRINWSAVKSLKIQNFISTSTPTSEIK